MIAGRRQLTGEGEKSQTLKIIDYTLWVIYNEDRGGFVVWWLVGVVVGCVWIKSSENFTQKSDN